MMLLSLWNSLLLLLLAVHLTEAALEFNYEVERRVYERLSDFMSAPKHAADLLARVKRNDYLDLLDYEDRDAFASMTYSLYREFEVDWAYYGTEEGMFLAYMSVNNAIYREPGDSYEIGTPEMDKYYGACVDSVTGEPENCTQEAGSEYISCIDDCSYHLCQDPETQSCRDSQACGYKQKWCKHYEIKKAHEGDSLGFIPRTDHCITDQGSISQERGAILQLGGNLGSCFYGDKTTRVQRNLTGNYAYCQKLAKRNGLKNSTAAVCDNVYVGGHRSINYDPRWRPWYIETKSLQRPNWSPPYVFFDNAEIGITYCVPFYHKMDGQRSHFAGVFASDYTFRNITHYLNSSYPSEDETFVVIYETANPNHLIASSTGREAATKVLIEDESKPCPVGGSFAEGTSTVCTALRVTMDALGDDPYDDVLLSAYLAQKDLGYPAGELVTSETDSQAYVSQSSSFKDGQELEWTILIISAVERSSSDALTKEDPLFAIVCVIAVVGFLACLTMFIFLFLKRKTRAVILADWRFTLAFLLGCALLNLSSLTFLGDHTEALCVARMWIYHLLFAVTMSPLFVKVYRMYRLVGSEEHSPAVISNPQAVAMTLPIVLIQLVILISFTIADPPVPEATITVDDSVVSQVIECTQESGAFKPTMVVYEGGLVFIGCVLAFMTRNLASNIGQSKELIFSMYNIAFVGIVTLVISAVTDIDAAGQAVFFSLGIFCGTVFSSAAFVIPRIYQDGQSLFQGMKGLSMRSSKVVKSAASNNNSKENSANAAGPAPSRKSGKTVSFGGAHTEAPVTGWSAMEDSVQEDADVNDSSGLGSKTFSGKIAPRNSAPSVPCAVSGWSAIEEEIEVAEYEEPSGSDRRASKRFSSKPRFTASSIPRVSGWSEIEREYAEDEPANDAPASKEFSDDGREEEEPPEPSDDGVYGSSAKGGKKQNKAPSNTSSCSNGSFECESPAASRDFSDNSLSEIEAASIKSEHDMQESWWDHPQSPELEAVINNLDEEPKGKPARTPQQTKDGTETTISDSSFDGYLDTRRLPQSNPYNRNT